ncbi:hypothetical protein SH528x_001146 [Novipirellula sp. SH528]|uniref:hypothetical protein n=1 Tax=Novipirellula sp. SH528 TaxID=3454466 RepID=UPI003FA137B1
MNASRHPAVVCRCRVLTPLVAVLMVITVGPMVAMAVDDVADKVEKSFADTKPIVPDPSVETASELSVAPLDQFQYPKNRPAWLNDSPKLEGADQYWIVVSTPAESRAEAVDELKGLQRAAVVRYVQGHTDGGSPHDFLTMSDEWIEENLITDRYAGEVNQGDTVLYENAVKLTFDRAIQSEISRAWKRVQVRDRLAATGVLVAGGLCCLVFSSFVTGLIGRRFS